MTPVRQTRRSFLYLATAPLLAGSASYVTLAGIRFMRIRKGSSSRRFLVIHGDEVTAREVMIGHMRSREGSAHLVESGKRAVRPHLLEIDPNRMFSNEGTARNLEKLNVSAGAADISREVKWIEARRGQLLRALLPPPGGLLIVLHNNARGYSVETEVPISNRVHLPSPSTPHEFFLATAETDFERIVSGPYNAVLQNEARGEDDGSLSRLCAARAIRYVNLECALGNREAQTRMVAWLDELLP